MALLIPLTASRWRFECAGNEPVNEAGDQEEDKNQWHDGFHQ